MKNIVKKNYYIRTTQSKIEGSSLLSKKREGRLMYQDKKRLFDDSKWIVKSIYCKRVDLFLKFLLKSLSSEGDVKLSFSFSVD